MFFFGTGTTNPSTYDMDTDPFDRWLENWRVDCARQEWQQDGALPVCLIFVVTLHPSMIWRLVPAFRREIEEVVDADARMSPTARVRRIGVEDVAAVVLVEDADAGQLVEAVLLVDPFIVVVELARRQVLLGEGHVVVEVEIASVGRNEIELPAHALLVGFEVGELPARHRDERSRRDCLRWRFAPSTWSTRNEQLVQPWPRSHRHMK